MVSFKYDICFSLEDKGEIIRNKYFCNKDS